MRDVRVKLRAANGKRVCGPEAPDGGVPITEPHVAVGVNDELADMAVKKTTKPKSKGSSQNKVKAAPKMTGNAAAASRTQLPTSVNESEYAIGDQISHPMFGHGTVAAIDVHTLTIEFKGNVVKQILDGYVKPHKA